MKRAPLGIISIIGPGVVIAATGVGAGDLITAAATGAAYGMAILWVVVVGAALKYFLNEGIGRWQLGSGITLLEGWIRYLPRWVSWLFLCYLVLWAFMVAGALINACALTAHSLFPSIPFAAWGILHSLAGLILVWVGRYQALEILMKGIIALMFIVVVVCAFRLQPDPALLLRGLTIPAIPQGSVPMLLGLMGGIGGSLTVMCYSYWIREKGWTGKKHLGWVHWDLGTAYTLTALFGVAMIIIASTAGAGNAPGSQILLQLAALLESRIGTGGRTLFMIGVWGAVFSSLLGVWQGVPYLFADFCTTLTQDSSPSPQPEKLTRSPYYRYFLLYLAFPPLLLLLFNKPVWIVILYSVLGAFFMPFLAATLLWMNNRSSWVGDLRNRTLQNTGLVLNLLLFGFLTIREILNQIG